MCIYINKKSPSINYLFALVFNNVRTTNYCFTFDDWVIKLESGWKVFCFNLKNLEKS